MIFNKLAVMKNKKGFTLIEIIVVLVILAILAAAAVPSMIGFVDDARGKAFIAEARVGFLAAQAVATEIMASGVAEITDDGEFDTDGDGSPDDISVTVGVTTVTIDTIIEHPSFLNMVSDVELVTLNATRTTATAMPFSAVVFDTASRRVTGITYTGTTAIIVISATGTTVTRR